MDPALYTNHTIVFFEKGTCHQVTFQFSIWLPFKTNEAQNIPFSSKIPSLEFINSISMILRITFLAKSFTKHSFEVIL